jgi:drug/metabolite transporter (DMT)-like permease
LTAAAGAGSARLAILAAAAIWGASFVAMQAALADLPVFHLMAFRFALGLLLVAPFVLRTRAAWRRAISRPALLVSAALFVGFALQTYGLLWTTPSRSAFLTGLSVLLVPFIAWASRTERPTGPQLGGTALAAAGLAVLYAPRQGAQIWEEFNRGDLLTILAACVFAAHLILVERSLPAVGVGALAAGQFSFVAGASSLSFLADPPRAAEFTVRALWAIALTGVFATAVAFACQLFAQSRLTAVETGVVLALEPVFAVLTSIALGVERWTFTLAVGGALLVAAMLLAQWRAPLALPFRLPRRPAA